MDCSKADPDLALVAEVLSLKTCDMSDMSEARVDDLRELLLPLLVMVHDWCPRTHREYYLGV